ncbi:MAG: insulinase family protein, partial [Oscillospiraceae bacterium]
LFVNHTVRDDIAGSVKSISHITAPMLYDCAKAFYSPSQMLLCVAGNITADTVLKACERANFKAEELNVEKLPQTEPDQINFSEKSINMPISVPMVAIGFKEKMSCPTTLKEEIIGEIIIDVLTGATGELFNKLYDANIVNGTFEGEIFSGKDYYATVISGESAEPKVLISEIEQAIDKFKITGVLQEEFITAKNSMYGSMIVDFENIEEVATNMVTAHFNDRSVYTPIEVLSSLTLEDVNSQLANMFDKTKRTIFTVLPMEK